MMKTVKHSFANYPTGFKGYVVSPTKICLQFSEPQINLRVDADTRFELKTLPNNDRYLEVPEHGINISVTAVGCQMPVVEQYQLALIDAYTQYYHTHSQVYTEIYGKDFKDFIKQVHVKIENLINAFSIKDSFRPGDNKYDDPVCTD